MSVSHVTIELLHLSEADVDFEGGSEGGAVVDFESEFTVIERQIFYFYIQWHFQMISQQQFHYYLVQFGFNEASFQTLMETKGAALQSMETDFKMQVTQSIE